MHLQCVNQPLATRELPVAVGFGLGLIYYSRLSSQWMSLVPELLSEV